MSALAYFDPTQNLMQFRDDIWMSAERGDIEGEYTVAHELGHFKYHHIPLYFRLEAYSQQEASQIPAEEHSEEQADLFACALSLPPKHLQRLLNKGVTLRYVSLRYKIPELNLERYIERLVSECGYDIARPLEQLEMF
jgi:Zn-dependent peptidase ImmA (M78 family)